ncbi:HEPN domain-containing protein [Gammaproteobacteria bacterium]|nr:HEPN domain-containing protein [Gammaproteobacteria bacterium]
MRSEELHENFRAIRDSQNFDENHRTRLHRAISWLKCAESYSENDADVAVIALWISFNSCYSIESNSRALKHDKRKANLLIEKLLEFDTENVLHNLLFDKYREEIKRIINNKFIYGRYWESRKKTDLDWQKSFTNARRAARRSLEEGDTAKLLNIIIARLYVLRNQLIHGGATYKGSINREQVNDAKGLLIDLIPVIIETMFNKADWGEISYPVVG